MGIRLKDARHLRITRCEYEVEGRGDVDDVEFRVMQDLYPIMCALEIV